MNMHHMIFRTSRVVILEQHDFAQRIPFAMQLREKREKLYIFSSHLGLIRCLTPVRVSAIIYFQAFLDKHRNTTNIILPHKLNHGSRMLSKQP